MSKKILSMALAVVMLISVFAFSATAAYDTTTFPGDGQIGLRVVSNAYVGMPEGETVEVKVYLVLPDDTDTFVAAGYRHTTHPIVLCYNSSAFEYDSVVNGYPGILKDTSANNITDSTKTLLKNVSAKFDANDKARGYNAVTSFGLGWDGRQNDYTGTTGFPVNQDQELFTASYTTLKTLEATDVIGVSSGEIANPVQTKVKYRDVANNKNVTYAGADVVSSEGFAFADVVKVNETATAKMRPGATAGTVDLGITGTVKARSFDAGKTPVTNASGKVIKHIAANLKEVGVQARVNGVIIDPALGTNVYETGDGFNFRAAITDIDADGLGYKIEVRTFIIDKNNNTYYSNWMNINAATVHGNAVGNGMTGII